MVSIKYMIIKNTTDQDISIVISGITLKVLAHGTKNVTEEQGSIWLKTHEFLEKSEDSGFVEPVVAKPEKVVVEEEKTVEVTGKVITKKK